MPTRGELIYGAITGVTVALIGLAGTVIQNWCTTFGGCKSPLPVVESQSCPSSFILGVATPVPKSKQLDWYIDGRARQGNIWSTGFQSSRGSASMSCSDTKFHAVFGPITVGEGPYVGKRFSCSGVFKAEQRSVADVFCTTDEGLKILELEGEFK